MTSWFLVPGYLTLGVDGCISVVGAPYGGALGYKYV
jgi:hypothetical protein